MTSRWLPCTSKIRVALVVAIGLSVGLGVPVLAAGAQGPIQVSTANGPGTVTVGATSSAAPKPAVGTPVWQSADGTGSITTSVYSPSTSTPVGGSIATSVSTSVAPGVFVSPTIQASPTRSGPNSAAAVSDPAFSVAVSCDAQAQGVLVITNVGGDMSVPFTWRLSLDGVPLAQNSFQVSSGQSFNISTSGLYGTLTLDVLDATNAVVATGSADCLKPPPPPPPAFSVAVSCDAQAQGVLAITNVGGNMPVPFTWRLSLDGVPLAQNSFQISPGQTFNISTSGLYGTLTLDVLDATNTVVATGSADCVKPPPPPPPSFTVTGACSAHAIGAFTITDVGGDMPAPYTWRIDKQGSHSRRPLATASFQINSGQSLNVDSVGQYGTFTLSILDTANKVVATGSMRCREDDHGPRHH